MSVKQKKRDINYGDRYRQDGASRALAEESGVNSLSLVARGGQKAADAMVPSGALIF